MSTARFATNVLAATTLVLASTGGYAGTSTNTLTSIATVTDACDIVGIGMDFGVTSVPLPAAGLSSIVTPNTSIGNVVTANTSHPLAAADGGATDTLALSAPAPSGTLINTALSAVSTVAPGVYVACTTPPTAITITSAAAGATPYNLPVTLASLPSGTFSGKMSGVGGGATSSNKIDYTMTFVGTPVSTAIAGLPLGLFIASFLATGAVPGSQGSVVPGFYADAATAQVDF
ncbi:MAG TPA: hypothetical protein VM240_08250 [Verrucomicrobiae bacterium]|nr:hypothetical protein [Verrucomicrobiae bacterium]